MGANDVAGACCSPSAPIRSPRGSILNEQQSLRATRAASSAGSPAWIALDAAEYERGSADPSIDPADGVGEIRRCRVEAFVLSATAVRNDEFAAFVEATGYVTDAERIGWAFVFGGNLPDEFEPTAGVAHAPWWRQVFGTTWRCPHGPQSDLAERGNHPVVQVSWADAQAYSAWIGARLPTEIEWEYTARGGLCGARFPWGDELEPDGEHRMNVWQGTFPSNNTAADGWYATCPVNAFPPNGLGFYNMTGNVWEWCEDRFDPILDTHRVLRGGSYLCHESYCDRYRVTGRSGSTPGSASDNTGFRCAR